MNDLRHFSNIESSWAKLRLKYAVSLSNSRTDGDSTDFAYVGLENIESGTGRLLPKGNSPLVAKNESESVGIVNVFSVGDVLFSKLRPYLAKAFVAETTGTATTELLVFKPNDELQGRFLLYVLLSPDFINLVDASTFGSKMPRADWEFIGNIFIPLPSLEKQRAIAAMLDAETARLDELIAEKERLLMLLAEKRRALITRAVTRGLDADAPLRDSGLEWLGDVPEHWKLVKLKYLAIVRTGVAKGRDLKNQQTIFVPYLRVANVQDGYLNLGDVTEIEILPHELKAYSLQPGDVLMNEGGDIDKLGRGAVWNNEISPCLHQNHVFAVRCKKVWPIWLSIITSATYAKAYFESHAKRTTNLASISATNIQELLIVMPPEDEQRAIVAYIAAETRKLDEMQEVTARTIGLLKERRAALIAAAVTGQIDVKQERQKPAR